jgi:hypothetical protein
MEDILDPSRNVDRAFRTTLLTMKDGDVQSGLFRREEGELLIFAQQTGKEFSIPKKDVQSRRESETSLMPDNFSEIIPGQDFNDLIAPLLEERKVELSGWIMPVPTLGGLLVRTLLMLRAKVSSSNLLSSATRRRFAYHSINPGARLLRSSARPSRSA